MRGTKFRKPRQTGNKRKRKRRKKKDKKREKKKMHPDLTNQKKTPLQGVSFLWTIL